ncbi:MAG: DsbA family protein [Candidatus Uhrbacteria bacterium]
MQNTHPFRRLLAGSLMPLILGLPLPSAAATTPSAQNMLNTALLRELSSQTMRSDMSLRLGMTQKSYKKTDPSGSASLAMHFQARQIAKAGSPLGDQEGRLSLDSFSIDEAISDGMPVSLDGPMSFQWKLVDRTAYFRVEQMPQNLLDMAKGITATDYSTLVGRWIKLDIDQQGLLPADLESGILDQNNPQMKALKALAIKAPPLLVTRVESKTKAANSHDMWRLRLRVNPAFINGVYMLAYKDLPKSPASSRKAALKELNTSFATIRTTLARTGLIAVLDATDQTLTRMEVGGSYPSPVKTCTFNEKTWKDVCKTTGNRTITVAIGMNMVKADGQPIIAPSDALDQAALEALIESLQPQQPPVDQQLDETQTLVAPGAAPTVIDNAVDHVLGSANAKVSVITYSDFECPFCQRMDPDLKKLLVDFPEDVRLVYRHFPLAFHESAKPAAEASECAAAQGGNDAFWKMHDKLIQNPTLQNRDGFLAFSDQIGLDRPTFATCLETHAQASRVQRDLDSGTAAGVNGTPASFVNGVLVEGAVPYSMLTDEVVKAGAIR